MANPNGIRPVAEACQPYIHAARGPAVTRPRWPAGLAMGFIALIAAVVSYNDGLGILHIAHRGGRIVYLYPLLPDGLIVICLLALYEAARGGLTRPRWATAGLILGAALTLAQNVGAGAATGILLAVIDGFVPVVFFVAAEVLIWTIRQGRVPAVPEDVPATAPDPEPAATVPAAPKRPSPDAGLDRLITWLTTGNDPEPVPARWQPPSHRQVREEYGVGAETAKKVRAGMVAAVRAASNGHGGA